MANTDLSKAQKLMLEYAKNTGLSPNSKEPQRYLWADAFAVCNFLKLYQQTEDEQFKTLALKLIYQVHNTLGQHRNDDQRQGWISGFSPKKGENYPTRGGLRIGKKLPERGLDEFYDQQLEIERDGQYYHDLTKWMHALNLTSRVTGDSKYNRWARELAQTAHKRFSHQPLFSERRALYSKMRIDLSQSLIPSMGQYDPLDGLITYHQLQVNRAAGTRRSSKLKNEISDMNAICEGRNWETTDALELGLLLCDAYKTAQLIVNEGLALDKLLQDLLKSIETGLESYSKMNLLDLPAHYRLAFRELVLSIGLQALGKLETLVDHHANKLKGLSPSLIKHLPISKRIEDFWLDQMHTEVKSWSDHRDINMVMLATSLAPDGFLEL